LGINLVEEKEIIEEEIIEEESIEEVKKNGN
jgi:hypothetical protein